MKHFRTVLKTLRCDRLHNRRMLETSSPTTIANVPNVHIQRGVLCNRLFFALPPFRPIISRLRDNLFPRPIASQSCATGVINVHSRVETNG